MSTRRPPYELRVVADDPDKRPLHLVAVSDVRPDRVVARIRARDEEYARDMLNAMNKSYHVSLEMLQRTSRVMKK